MSASSTHGAKKIPSQSSERRDGQTARTTSCDSGAIDSPLSSGNPSSRVLTPTNAVRPLIQAVSQNTSQSKSPPLDAQPASCSELRVLVVDDNAFFRARWKMSIERHGFVVETADGGTDAIARAKRSNPVAILLDVQMPDMDGFAVCAALKKEDATRDIPVIFITAEDKTEQKVRGFENGGADYVTKTADEAEVVARLRTHVNLAVLQRRLRDSRAELEQKLVEIQEYVRHEQEMSSRIKDQQAQLLQADKLASIGKLAAGVAHEINNPIGFVSSNLNSLGRYMADVKTVFAAHDGLLDRCEGNPELAPLVAEVRRLRAETDMDFVMGDLDDLIRESVEGTERVRQIVADLRDFSHIDSPELAEEDINHLLDKTINVARNELKYKTEIVRNYGELNPIPCYGGKLGQVFLNLLVNAAHAIDDRGTITIQTGISNSAIWIEIQDTGCGIPDENLARIFDPFFTTKAVGKGTGLGLHLARTIVQGHGGTIQISSTVGVGTTVRVDLPQSGPNGGEKDGGGNQ